MGAPVAVGIDVVDDHAQATVANLVADRFLDLEFAARLQPELDLVEHLARYPAILRYPRDSGEAHVGHRAHFGEHAADHVVIGERKRFCLVVVGHLGAPLLRASLDPSQNCAKRSRLH